MSSTRIPKRDYLQDPSFQELIRTLRESSAASVVLDEIDNKLNTTFWTIYNKRIFRKENFDTLRGLMMGNLYHYIQRVHSISYYDIENDFITNTKLLKEAIEETERNDRLTEEVEFLKALDIYHDGLKELEAYQKNIRIFLRLVQENYEKFYNSRCGVNHAIYTFDHHLARFSCTRVAYVANHGIIATKLYFR